MKALESYAMHAETWGFFSGDRAAEVTFWETLAKKYGEKVLSLMTATGDMAAVLARRGLQVTGVDFIPAMIAEGRRRYGDIASLTLVEGDVRSFSLPETDFDFAFTSDFNHLMTQTDGLLALQQIGRHLRPGAALALDLWFPAEKSWATPQRRFDPLQFPPNPALRANLEISKTWKEGKTSYDAARRLVTIEQEVYVQRGQTVESFSHHFQMQLWKQEEITAMLQQAGFSLEREYGSYSFERWKPGAPQWIMETKYEGK